MLPNIQHIVVNSFYINQHNTLLELAKQVREERITRDKSGRSSSSAISVFLFLVAVIIRQQRGAYRKNERNVGTIVRAYVGFVREYDDGKRIGPNVAVRTFLLVLYERAEEKL